MYSVITSSRTICLCIIVLCSQGQFPFRKMSIGSDCMGLFFILYYLHRRTEKVETTLTLYHRIIGSNWNKKLVPKAHARVQFYSDPVRSHAYFPEWKPALRQEGKLTISGAREYISVVGGVQIFLWASANTFYPIFVLKDNGNIFFISFERTFKII